MDDLFVHALRDIYYAENRFVKALPDMIEKASNPQLKQALGRILARRKPKSCVCRNSSGCMARK